MSEATNQLLDDARKALQWLLNNIRQDAPQLSGKAMGNAERVITAIDAALPQPAPSPQAPGRRKGPPGITLEPQGHEPPAVVVGPKCRDCADFGPNCPNSGKPCNSQQPAVPVVSDEQIDAATRHMYHNGRPTTKEYRVGIVRAIPALRPATLSAEFDVRNIMLDVVPGDGSGFEVYAKNVGDVERALAEMDEKLETLEGAQNTRPAVEPMTWPKGRDVGRYGDMSPGQHLRVGLDSDNDAYVSVWDEDGGASVEFCNPGGGGGGSSRRTREALIALMVAIEADNAERPDKDWWARRNGIAAKAAGGA